MADIQRLIRLTLYLVIGLLLGGVSAFAFAGTYPATQTWGLSSSTPAGACQEKSHPTYTFDHYTSYSANGVYCYWLVGGGLIANLDSVGLNVTCPNGGTLSGTTCTKTCTSPQVMAPNGACVAACPSGQTMQNDGSCVTPCAAAGTAGPGTGTATGGSGGSAPSTVCVGGCTYGTTTAVGMGSSWGAILGYSTGSSCTGSTTSTPQTDPKTACVDKGMGYGTVNGTVICTAPSSVTTQQTATTNGTTTSPTGTVTGSGSTTGGTSSTTCTGDSCTTTTTTTTTSGGSGAGGTGAGSTTQAETKTKTETKAAFCEENPNSTICKTSSFGDSACSSAPSCDGDAVQCATAKQLWQLKCDFTPQDTTLSTLGTQVVAGNDPVVSPADPSKVTNISIPGMLNTSETYGASCPPDMTITMMGHSKTVPMGNFCTWAGWLGSIGVALSLLTGAFIVVGAIKG